MASLSDTQLVVLGTACQRPDRNVLPLPANLKGGAAGKVVDSLIAKGLIKEVRAKRDEPVWRTDDERGRIALRVTRAAFDALGIDPATAGGDDAEQTGEGADAEAPDGAAVRAARKKNARAGVITTRAGTKQAQLIDMLQLPEGATIDEIVQAFGWQPHTVRGAFAGALKKRLGLDVTSEKVDHRGRVYRICTRA
ncbi:DUF3489 domain-containing protein [Rhodoplanes serenus]|uniref:DUF3489 domain-containing protein n=1 Tax=Rhodoplanes serenus TaxID=200615 RepID=A0A9X4XPE7_9BRAD|nr:DUF3489 domain-containing protein [Rhodoplanes serenus]MTW18337.1 DUF3489 domain-containing protein [Rhodoplanes serenus]